jgi:F0F1-type ATP synthase assembly protein I
MNKIGKLILTILVFAGLGILTIMLIQSDECRQFLIVLLVTGGFLYGWIRIEKETEKSRENERKKRGEYEEKKAAEG